MHSAPAVSFPVGRSRFQGGVILFVFLACSAIALVWHGQTDLAIWRQGLFLVCSLVTCAIAAVMWRRSPQGSLRWDGQDWSWTEKNESQSGRLSVHLDFQFFLLVSLRTECGVRLWLWPERQAMALRWHDLRRAVFSRTRVGPNQDLVAVAQSQQGNP